MISKGLHNMTDSMFGKKTKKTKKQIPSRTVTFKTQLKLTAIIEINSMAVLIIEVSLIPKDVNVQFTVLSKYISVSDRPVFLNHALLSHSPHSTPPILNPPPSFSFCYL